MSEKVHIGMVGCGGMASAHRGGYNGLWDAGLRSFNIDATCDINEDAAKNMAEEIVKFQSSTPRVYTDLDDMLTKEGDLTAVDISTVHRAHHTLAIPCFEAGL
ncbi:MAG: Gfo/Idh/MocA family oxidoreductase, partial [Candidatus Latescibacteria bacterium]|nr:Gfo/Idh/MocA family oxidoreductase [Candidatus Latescibacterota bacterium]